MNHAFQTFYSLVGSDDVAITWTQMSLRAVIIFLYGLALVRVGPRRIFGKNTVFDILLAVILGSALSRAVTGNAPFLPTLAAATALVLLHALLGRFAQRATWFGRLVKGTEVELVRDGRIDDDALRRVNITLNDLHEALRLAGVSSPAEVRRAILERNGSISVLV